MNAKIEITKQITLVLNEEETFWLMSIMQNPIYGNEIDKEMQNGLLTILNSLGL